MFLWPSSDMITERSWVNIFKISLEILLSLNHQRTKRARDRERQFPIQTCCWRANGSSIMIDGPESLSSGTLNGVGTDQYLHWRWSHVLLLLGSNITEREIHSSHWHCLPFSPNWVSENPPKSPFVILSSFKVQWRRRRMGLLQF